MSDLLQHRLSQEEEPMCKAHPNPNPNFNLKSKTNHTHKPNPTPHAETNPNPNPNHNPRLSPGASHKPDPNPDPDPNSNVTASPSPSPNRNSHVNPWGTWEELILASAVKKHGPDNWALISAELQSRAKARFSFTPEACRAEYQAIKLRFGSDEGRKGSVFSEPPLFEELRKLRVAQLRQELKHFDSSIGSLEVKIQKLELEKKKGGENTEPGPPDGAAVDESAVMELQKAAISPREETNAVPSTFSHEERTSSVEASSRDDAHLPFTSAHHPCSLLQHEDRTQSNPQNGSHSDSEAAAGVVISPDVLNEIPHSLSGEGGTIPLEALHVHLHARSLPKDMEADTNIRVSVNGAKKSDPTLLSETQGARNFMWDNSMVEVGQEEGESGAMPLKGYVSISTSQNLDHHKGISNLPLEGGTRPLKDEEDDDGSKSNGSESLCSSRIKSSPSPSNCRGNVIGFGASRTSNEARMEHYDEDDDDKRLVYRVASKINSEAKRSRLFESGDSIEASKKDVSSLNNVCMTGKVKMEMFTLEDTVVPSTKTVSTERPISSKPKAISSSFMKAEEKKYSTSSSDNSHLREVWGESAEVEDKRLTSASMKERRYGRKRKFVGNIEVEKNVDGPSTHPECSAKTESTATSSHEVSESQSAPVGLKDGHDVERFSGDSRAEKSEMGSYVDGNEDISPMSRRNRREPKVPGKLIPLLDCLRTVCAHRYGSIFKHNHDNQDNRRYNLVVRMPMDLGIVRTKLEDGHYSGSFPFFRDLLLMVNNALVYYAKGSPESVAAAGLRDCIVSEMRIVFEKEALVKQEGPSFRKREAGRASNQGRTKALKASPTPVEKPKDLLTLDVPARQNLSTPCEERVVKPTLDKVLVTNSIDHKRVSDNKMPLKVSERSSPREPSPSSRGRNSSIPKDNGKDKEKVIESSSLSKYNDLSKGGGCSKVDKEKVAESSSLISKHNDSVKASTSKMVSTTLLNNTIEGNTNGKTKDVKPKRGAGRPPGRPPKHSQKKSSQKEMSVNQPRKRVRR